MARTKQSNRANLLLFTPIRLWCVSKSSKWLSRLTRLDVTSFLLNLPLGLVWCSGSIPWEYMLMYKKQLRYFNDHSKWRKQPHQYQIPDISVWLCKCRNAVKVLKGCHMLLDKRGEHPTYYISRYTVMCNLKLVLTNVSMKESCTLQRYRHIDVFVCRGKYTTGIVRLIIIYLTYNTQIYLNVCVLCLNYVELHLWLLNSLLIKE